MTNEHTTLNGLFGDIADSIRAKTGDEDLIKADNFPDAILNIPTASGGLHLNTEINLSANRQITAGIVTLTAVLTADYDDISASDVDLHGCLEGATITFYDENGTSLYSGITNSNGVVTFNETISADTTFYCRFEGTSDYDSCISNNVTVEKGDYYFYDSCNFDNASHYTPTTVRNGGIGTVTFDSTNQCYLFTATHTGEWFAQIPELTGLNNYEISFKAKKGISTTVASTCIGIIIKNSNFTDCYLADNENAISSSDLVLNTPILSENWKNQWITYKVKVSNSRFEITIFDENDNQLATVSRTTIDITSSTIMGICHLWGSANTFYIKEIAVEKYD